MNTDPSDHTVVYGRLLAGIEGLNQAGNLVVCLLCVLYKVR